MGLTCHQSNYNTELISSLILLFDARDRLFGILDIEAQDIVKHAQDLESRALSVENGVADFLKSNLAGLTLPPELEARRSVSWRVSGCLFIYGCCI
jgi:hypothetical protein